MTTFSFSNSGRCKYCDSETRNINTHVCNGCYQLKVRISSNPMRALKLIKDLFPNEFEAFMLIHNSDTP